MNKQEKVIVQQLQDLVAHPPPQVRNLKWFWSLQDLVGKFDVEEDPKGETLEEKKEREADEKYREEHGLDLSGKPIVYPGEKEPLEELDDIETAKEETEE